LGELYSLAAAVVWAMAVILFTKSGETVPPFSLNLFRVVVSLVVFLPLLVAVRGEALLGGAPLRDIVILFASGVLGIAVSDTLFHASLNRVGAGISAIVDCLYAPLVVLTAFLLIGERIGAAQYAGMALVIAGVLVAARHRPPAHATRGTIVAGIVFGALAMSTLAVSIVMAKPVLNRSGVLWATVMRQLGTILVMAPVAFLSPRRREILSVFRPAPSWRYTLVGTLLGSCLALILWIAGMKYTLAGKAAIINQSTTVFILLFASIFLREPFTRRKAVAAVLSLGGILLVTQG
jgi:drug/metabolite transporter (DMT)-like permease